MSVIAELVDQTSEDSGCVTNPWPGFSLEPWDENSPTIRLEQIDKRWFRLTSTVRYTGPTGIKGLDAETDQFIRSLSPDPQRLTDLASIPRPLRWWINTYGVHTPAALIHDRFIGPPSEGDPGRPEGVSEQAIDRYFRFMLRELGVPFYRRWLMWAAVACRTRLHAGLIRRTLMIVWFLTAVFGIGLFVKGAISTDPTLALVAAVLPLPASALWGRQAFAAAIIAYVGVPCLLVPTAVTIPFLAVYAVVEAIGKQCSQLFLSGSEPGGQA